MSTWRGSLKIALRFTRARWYFRIPCLSWPRPPPRGVSLRTSKISLSGDSSRRSAPYHEPPSTKPRCFPTSRALQRNAGCPGGKTTTETWSSRGRASTGERTPPPLSYKVGPAAGIQPKTGAERALWCTLFSCLGMALRLRHLHRLVINHQSNSWNALAAWCNPSWVSAPVSCQTRMCAVCEQQNSPA